MADAVELDPSSPGTVSSPPRVVGVVVTHDPGPWFDETLHSLAAQDHPGFQVVVLDNGSAGAALALRERVTQIVPDAKVYNLGLGTKYGAAANEVLQGGVAGADADDADFFLFCHDDVALEPGTATALVDVAERSNAGMVGPKVVEWENSRRLLQMGRAVRSTATTVPLVERGEFDQGQYDGTREVFAVSGAVTLVRSRLFRRIGGFDEDISLLGDDLSLCWRARVAGGRVVVTSQTRVRHREQLTERVPERHRHHLAARHRARILLTCYGWRRRWSVVPAAAVMSVLRCLVALGTGRVGVAWSEISAWLWNLARPRSRRIARRQVKRFRRVGDPALRRLQVPRVRRSGRSRRERGALPGAAVLGTMRHQSSMWTTGSATVVVVLVGLLVLGSRHLLTRGVPQIGQFVAFDPPEALFAEWFEGWRRTGLGSSEPAPALHPLLAGLGALVGGHMELLRTVLTVGLLPLGIFGVFRNVRCGTWLGHTCSPRAAVGAAVAYAIVPLPYTAFGDGRWDTLAVYAAAPWLLARVLLAGGGQSRRRRLPPDSASPLAAIRRPSRREGVLALGVLTALVAMVVPGAHVLVAILAVGLAAGSLLAYELRPAANALVVGVGAAVVAGVLHLPWTAAAIRSGDALSWWDLAGVGEGVTEAVPASVAALPLGLEDAPALWALLGTAVLPLVVGRDWRLTAAVRGWTLALGSYVLVAVHDRNTFGLGDLPLPRSELVLVLAVAGITLAVASGMAAIDEDVTGRSRRFGMRRLMAVAGVTALAGASVPTLPRVLDGTWAMPTGDFTPLVTGVDTDTDSVPSRFLWVGHPDAVPGGGWPLDDAAGPALTFTTGEGRHPTVSGLLAGPPTEADRLVADALEEAMAGTTARLGRTLAPMAIKYVVVPLQAAPGAEASQPPPQDLLDGLAGQLDLQRVTLDSSLVVYRNLAFMPGRAAVSMPGVGEMRRPVPTNDEWVAGQPSPEDLALQQPEEVRPVLEGHEAYRTGATGQLEGDSIVFHSAAESEHWALYVDGVRVERRRAFDWANAFVVAQPGEAELRYETPWEHRLLLLAQAGAWLTVVVMLVRIRGRVGSFDRSEDAGGRDRQYRRTAVGPTDDWIEYVKVLPPEVGAGTDHDGDAARSSATGAGRSESAVPSGASGS